MKGGKKMKKKSYSCMGALVEGALALGLAAGVVGLVVFALYILGLIF
jgi:hypothetical protein